ncbi:hypothetical protein B0H13DRAFT_2300626 [Mycena leptocephala]|nr:hypothetical protein B0H13DRAFT_2300626 [Mycena leptocephala]
MSSATTPTIPAVPAAEAEARSSFPFTRSARIPMAATPEVAQGRRELDTSISAPPIVHDVRKEGGIPSSAAFASEQAKDSERFAALDPDKRDKSSPFSSQMKRDFLQSQEAAPAPPGFATGPSHAARPISRTASMAAEVSDTTLDSSADDGDASPLFLANQTEAETALVGAIRANGNVTRVGGKLMETDARLDALMLSVQNGFRAMESNVNRGPAASTDSGANLTPIREAIAALSHRLDLVTTSFLCDDDGVPIPNVLATQTDIHALHASVQNALNGTDEWVTEQLHPITSDVSALAARVMQLEAEIAVKTAELLAVRENVARTTLDTASLLTRTAKAAPAATVAAMTPSANAFEFAVGKKQVKRKASVELGSAPKRHAGRPDKGSFHHWVHVGPVVIDTRLAAPVFFKKLLESALGVPAAANFPSVYVERLKADPTVINVGFSSANSANMFIGQ